MLQEGSPFKGIVEDILFSNLVMLLDVRLTVVCCATIDSWQASRVALAMCNWNRYISKKQSSRRLKERIVHAMRLGTLQIIWKVTLAGD